MVSKKLESIKDGVAAVNTAVETPALLYFNKKALDDALQEKGQLAMKFADTFALRQVVAGCILAVKGTEISESNVILQDRCDRFRNGSIDLKPESRRSYYNCTAEMESRGESSGENESEEGEKSEPQASEYYAQQLFQKDIVDKLKSLVGTV